MLPDWITSHARVLLLKWKVIELFHLVASSYANLLEQTNVFTQEIGSTPTGLIWDTNMAAVLLFWDKCLQHGGSDVTWKRLCSPFLPRPQCTLITPFPPSPPPPQKIRNHCFHFLLGITVVPRQIEGNVHAKFWGVNKVNYGFNENGQ